MTSGPLGGLAAPRYGEASLADVLPSALSALGIGDADPLGLAPAQAVVVLVVDGLGARQLALPGVDAPYLTAQPSRVLDTVFPATTAAALTSLGTGLPPGQHGITGYAIGHPGHDEPLNLLTWRVGPKGGGDDARDLVVPERFQPRQTALERAEERGARVAVVVDPAFADSGLTRAGLRGGTRVEAVGLARTLETAVAATRGRGPTLVYAHHPDVDKAGHVFGPGSEEWCQAVAAVDDEVERIAERLPRGTTLLVTADHGMVACPRPEVVELSEVEGLCDGVRVVAGEPRVRQLWCERGAADDVLAAWREALAGRALVVSRAEAIAAGWFGPVADHVVERIGEVVAVAAHGSMAHRDVDPFDGLLLGQHGALSRDELEIPLVEIAGG